MGENNLVKPVDPALEQLKQNAEKQRANDNQQAINNKLVSDTETPADDKTAESAVTSSDDASSTEKPKKDNFLTPLKSIKDEFLQAILSLLEAVLKLQGNIQNSVWQPVKSFLTKALNAFKNITNNNADDKANTVTLSPFEPASTNSGDNLDKTSGSKLQPSSTNSAHFELQSNTSTFNKATDTKKDSPSGLNQSTESSDVERDSSLNPR